jgi:tRNA pseudouridine32 synthase/23S rRNA pseudouridine746 synthase
MIRESQFQKAELRRLKKRWNEQVAEAEARLKPLDDELQQLKQERKHRSDALQRWLFDNFLMLNTLGKTRSLTDIFSTTPQGVPPSGSGECCAPKLLQYAYQHGLKPVCMAEFWWGAPTKEELRQHLNYYPACRGKCKPILTWMLQGLDVDPDPETLGLQHLEIPTVYEDNDLLVIDKPSGILSVPGRIEDYSVETVMRERYPDSIVAHRLDMGTSGLLIVAKNGEAYRILQQQFIHHEVKKKYLALLELPGQGTGVISLPLRPDPMNRPRQVVDMAHGKRAVTRYEYISDRLVALWPETGRTHQLRIHCAHPDGLANPIVGDELYGTRDKRLCLHAAEIWFRHPVTGSEMHFETTPNFI